MDAPSARTLRRLGRLLPAALLLSSGAAWWSARSEATARAADLSQERRLVAAVDGDTVELDGLGRVRILGINAPETFRKRTAPDGKVIWERLENPDPRAVAAYEYLRSLEGRRVRVQRDRESCDRYGRALAHLYLLPDGPDLASELLRRGWVETLILAPNDRRAGEWKAAEKAGRRKAAK